MRRVLPLGGGWVGKGTGAFWFAGRVASGWRGSIFGVLGSLGVGAAASSASSCSGFLLARQQPLGPCPLQPQEAVQRPPDLAIRLAPVAQHQRQAGAGIPVVVQGLGEAAAGLREAGQQLAFEALGPAGAEDAGGDGLREVPGDGADGAELGADGGEVGLVGLLGLAQGWDGDVDSGAEAVGEAVHRGAAPALLGDRPL
jgi:hypothetical protein